MQAFDNPTFVEDVVRNIAVFLDKDKRITNYDVNVVNHESIHEHNAYAKVSKHRA